tara:strand:- start:95 stop:643 length:549 start_codon:yes stop_codon:yes gene_type:complete
MNKNVVQEVLFTDLECDILLNNATEFNETKLTTKAPDGQLNYNYVDKSHRNSTEGKYDLTPELKKMITDKCSKHGVIGLGPKARIVRYETGQYFRKHRDKTKYAYQDRIKTFIIQLSNSDDYEGGDLKLYHGKVDGKDIVTTTDRTRGNVIIFDSDIRHELQTVTSGTRYAFVCWLMNYHLS